jgi:hypothetical protein
VNQYLKFVHVTRNICINKREKAIVRKSRKEKEQVNSAIIVYNYILNAFSWVFVLKARNMSQ